jgi:serine protease
MVGNMNHRKLAYQAIGSLSVLFLCACWDSVEPEDAGIVVDPTSGLSGQMTLFNAAAVPNRYLEDRISQQREAIAAAQAAADPNQDAPGQPPHDARELENIQRTTAATDKTPNWDAPQKTHRIVSELMGDRHRLNWRPGELMVVFEEQSYTKAELKGDLRSMLTAIGEKDVYAEVLSCSAQRFCLVGIYDHHGKGLDREETRRIEQALQPNIQAPMHGISCNFIKHAFRVPNDPYYILQWHHEFARMPAAWDVSTGSDDIIVAVIDTGLVLSHPDVETRVVQGVDMISDASIAGDGNGRDTDPTDPGDGAYGNGQSSWHGTHTAGIIAAETNNGEGVSAITWAGKVQPVRVLGMGSSGSDFDILSGIFWAAGDANIEDVPQNQNPARVINLSLGGPASQEGYNNWVELLESLLVTDAEAYNYPIVVVAAGNQDQIVDNTTPANIDLVITVGATRYDGRRASYSNWGNAVDIMAPGGQTDKDQNADGYPDGILSLFDNDYNFEQGTSMAAPVVSGVAALLLAIDPTLTHGQIEDILQQTGNANGMCDEGCGAGHLDAAAALLSAGGVVSDTPQMAIDRTRLIFQPDNNSLAIQLYNIGTGSLIYDLELAGAQYSLFSIDSTTGSVGSGEYISINIELDRSGFTSGFANLWIKGTGEADGQELLVDLSFVDDQIAPIVNVSYVQVGAYEKTTDTTYRLIGDYGYARSTDDFVWDIFGLPLGDYYVFAIGDDNGDGNYDALTESFGAWPTTDTPLPIAIEQANLVYSDVNFGLSGGFALEQGGGVGDACEENADCKFTTDAECIFDWQDGYCSRECNDGYCGAGASCELLDCGGAPCNICLVTCTSDSQCRTSEGYACDVYGTCTPSGL